MSDLGVIVPSRGRPANVERLIGAWQETVTGSAILAVAVDDDDPALQGYLDLFARGYGPHIGLVVGPRRGMVGTLNQLAVPAAEVSFALAFLGDDHVPRTVGWDESVVAALKDLGTGLVSGPDGFRKDHLPTWCAMTSDIVRTLGYMAPPGLRHMYVDNAWLALGRQVGFTYLECVLVEHMHPFAGKAATDEGYARVNDAAVYAQDAAAFTRWCADDLPAAAAKLGPGWDA